MQDNIYYIILLCIVEIFGDFALEKYAINKNGPYNYFYLLSGCILYIFVVYFLIKSLENSNILYVNGMWDGISAIIESLSAMIFLGESFQHNIQYLGLVFIIIGLFFIKKNNPFLEFNKLYK
jgi:multidrug transporter EmrE-like cation transporter